MLKQKKNKQNELKLSTSTLSRKNRCCIPCGSFAKEEKKAAGRQPKETSILDYPIVRSAGRSAAAMITRSLLGVLGLGGTTRRRRSRSFF